MVTLLSALDLAREWRPQKYGRKRAHEIDDAIVEPLWDGPRVLIAVEEGLVAPFHEGTKLAGPATILDQLVGVTAAAGIVLEGHLTEQALSTGEGASIEIHEKPPGTMNRLLGNLGGGKRDKLIREKEEAAAVARRTEQVVSGSAGPLAFVATDLLWLDGEPLLDVPLLERKRLLDSAIGESELVRRTAFVRPTARGSLIGWKALGFRTLAYKAANSRYRPGEMNDGWAIVDVTGPSPAGAPGR
jgi:hypothetical protein